jgi:hypothetical protein
VFFRIYFPGFVLTQCCCNHGRFNLIFQESLGGGDFTGKARVTMEPSIQPRSTVSREISFCYSIAKGIFINSLDDNIERSSGRITPLSTGFSFTAGHGLFSRIPE